MRETQDERGPHPTPLDVNKQSLRDAPNHQIQPNFFFPKILSKFDELTFKFYANEPLVEPENFLKKIRLKKSLKREQIKWHEGVGEVEIKFLKNLKKF